MQHDSWKKMYLVFTAFIGCFMCLTAIVLYSVYWIEPQLTKRVNRANGEIVDLRSNVGTTWSACEQIQVNFILEKASQDANIASGELDDFNGHLLLSDIRFSTTLGNKTMAANSAR